MNNYKIISVITLTILITLSSCDMQKSMTVEEVKEKYTIEELEELYRIKQDSTIEGITFNKQLEEESKTMEIDTIQKAMFVIYGPDDRIDFYDETIPERIKNSMGVVAIVSKDSLVNDGNENYVLKTENFGKSIGLCDTERFNEQPIGTFCSGFAVEENIIVTAGHCIKSNDDLENVRFIFGFKANSKGNINITFNKYSVFSGKRIISRGLDSSGLDYAVIETNESIPESQILTLNDNAKISENENVYVIGHPSGLPLKIADGANVRDNSNPLYFVANLDSYGGNSGSPIFNANTHEVEGILVRGEIDFVKNGNCAISNSCPDTGCRGEDVSRVSQFIGFLDTELIQ